MAERRQLPPQIRRVELARRAGSKTVVRYQLTVDTGIVDGKRKQLRRRYRTEKEAREIQGQVTAGSYVHSSTLTVSRRVLTGCSRATRSDPPRRWVMNTSCNPCAASSAAWPSRI